MFDYAAHCRALSANPELVLRRNKAIAGAVQWTPEMDAKLVEMAVARKGAIPIAKAIGVGKHRVKARRIVLGLPKGRPPGPTRKARSATGNATATSIY